MLPKIHDRSQSKDTVAYHNFTRDIMAHRLTDNNICKLKLMKQFLEDDACDTEIKLYYAKTSRQSQRKVSQSIDYQKSDKMKFDDKQDRHFKESDIHNINRESGSQNKNRRQSLVSQAYCKENELKVIEKPKPTVFTVPDRLKLSELLTQTGKKQTIKCVLETSLKMNSQLYTHRIL